ncbi:FYVE and coiled-coil domain-containing protein 1-like isoform X2 [Ornithodoros turicata]|uniref:FYVE and coiled-coil domain-containing protein 1-like isoform X2 n=1 Tax=Ornithodoros turicata TaxID=34597 RepID=UPI003139E77C
MEKVGFRIFFVRQDSSFCGKKDTNDRAPVPAMASGIHIDKVVADIREFVKELCKEYQETLIPINDDNVNLHKLCTKLEHVVQHGQKDKFTFLGNPKDYWDYFYRCFASESSCPAYGGITYAKSLSEVKTSLGRGRAFIRFCLMFKCLPDTLKACADNVKATSEFYQDWSILHNSQKFHNCIASLYDLNAAAFDLSPGATDLDVSWPHFAKKTNYSWIPQNKRSSITSITVPVSGNKDGPASPVPSSVPQDVFEQMKKELQQKICDAEAATAESARALQVHKDEQKQKEERWKEREEELLAKLAVLENAGMNGSAQDSSTETDQELDKVLQQLATENKDLSVKNGFLTRRLNEILQRLEDSEEALVAARQSELELQTRMEKLRLVNEGLKNLVDAVRQENTILRQQAVVMDKEIHNTHILLEQKKVQCKCLDDQLTELRSKCCEALNSSALKDKKIKKLASILCVIRKRHVTSSKSPSEGEGISSVDDRNVNCDVCDSPADGTTELSALSANNDKVQYQELCKVVDEFPSGDSSTDANSELFEHCLRYLGSALLQQESLIEKASSRVKDLSSATHSINLQLHVLQEVLSMKPPEDAAPSNGHTVVSQEIVQTELTPPRIEGCDFITTLFETLCRNHAKLHGLMQAESQLDAELADCRELNSILASKVHEQERKLCGFVQELDRTKVLLETLEGTHQKLQTAKAVMRYELQEKKHILKNLKAQLETTRENSARVRRSNAESELEWKSLREEFTSRKKQDSQDSGLSDAGHSSREQSPSSGDDTSEKDDPDSVEDFSSAVVDSDNDLSRSPHMLVIDIEERYRIRSQRLEFLEQQCRILYNSLVRSTERSNGLQRRLHSLLRGTRYDTSPTSSSSSDDDAPPVPPSELQSALAVITEEAAALPEERLLTDYESDVEETSQDDSLPEIRKRTLDTVVQRVKMEKFQSEEAIANLRQTITELQEANERLTLQITQMADERLQREKDVRQRACDMLKNERCMKSVQVQELTKERDLLLEQRQELLLKLQEKDEKIAEMEKNNKKTMQAYSTLEEEVAVLTEKLQYQTSSHDHIQQSFAVQQTLITEMKDRIEDQEKSLAELEQSLVGLREDRIAEQTQFFTEMEQVQLVVASREEECLNLGEELRQLRVQADQDRHQNEQLKTELAKAKQSLTTLEGDLKQMSGDSDGLKKQIIRLVKEKDLLWKENDNLQYLQRVQATDKWMNNSETDCCLHCSTQFTLTMRKHHCRLCGKIFCHNCSNNWLMTTASRNPTRVCNDCTTRNEELMRNARRVSITSTVDSEFDLPDASGYKLQKSKTTEIPFRSKRTSIPSHLAEEVALCSSAPSLQSSSPRTMPKIVRNWSFPRLRKLQYLQRSPRGGDDKNFDIISDEEIARSLSACSPYNSFSPPASTEISFHQSSPRTADDIADCGDEGCRGELWVNAGASCGIPIHLDVAETTIRYQFTSDPKTVSFEIKYRSFDADVDAMDVILPSVSVQASPEPVEGQLIVRDPGLYMLVFDNQHSKFMAKKICYKLHAQKPCKDGQASSCV